MSKTISETFLSVKSWNSITFFTLHGDNVKRFLANWSRNSTQIFVFLDRVIPYQPSMIKVAQIQTTFVVVSHEQRCTPNVIETTGNIFYVILWEELSVNSESSNTYQCSIIANVHFMIWTVCNDFSFVIFALIYRNVVKSSIGQEMNSYF